LFLKKQGVTDIIAISSVGSLRANLTPGTIIIPDDYINLFNIKTFFDKKATHIIPGLNENLRNKIKKATEKINQEIIFTGTYFQTSGPRFETKAEIKMISQFADIVGMTMANEATLAKELGLNYACICMIDNYANGIKPEIDLTEDDFKKAQLKNISKITKLLNEILK